MRYGNRGMNQPCIDLRTGRCYITPQVCPPFHALLFRQFCWIAFMIIHISICLSYFQNHGYAVDPIILPSHVHQLFLNANDNTNEGIIQTDKPWWFSCRFHPEAMGGPEDTSFYSSSSLILIEARLLLSSCYRLSTTMFER